MLRLTAVVVLLIAGALQANESIAAGSPLALLVKKKVQDDLSLTTAQVATFKQLYEEAEKSGKAIPTDAVSKALKPEQAARLREISIQIRGGSALADPEITKALKITAEQQKKIASLWKNSEEDLRQIARVVRAKSDAEMRKWVLVQRRDAGKELLKVLTEEQVAAFKKMQGAAIETKGLDN